MKAAHPFHFDLPEPARRLYDSTFAQLFKSVEWDRSTPLIVTPEGGAGEITLSEAFLHALSSKQLDHQTILTDEGVVVRRDGGADLLSSIVYVVNYLQEQATTEADALGRFPYAASLQARFESSERAVVLEWMHRLLDTHQLGHWQTQRSKLFVSHDNDGLFRGFKQDGMYALRKGRIDWLVQVVFSEVMRRPRWFNMDRIMDINDAYDLKSTFFWLVEQGDVRVGERALRNADYAIDDPRIQQQIKRIEKRGFEQGLHKAISGMDFREEMRRLPFPCHANRNHFLKLRLPAHFREVDEAGLALDFSLGFAERPGLRNGFALPYRPFDLDRQQHTQALFVPLMIMDTTNWTYQKLGVSAFERQVVGLIEQHQNDAVISLLWHNKYFTGMKFKGYLRIYKSMLEACKQLGIMPVTQAELIQNYR